MLRDLKTPEAEVEIVKRDIEDSLKRGNMLKLSDQQRAAYLAKNPQFQAWLQSRLSDSLIIDGMGDVTIVSPMSYFTAMFSQELRKVTNVVSASFFCGSSSKRAQNSSATSVLMRSLNSQLLANPLLWPSLDLGSLSKNISNLNYSSPEESWDLFSHLISRVKSSTTVYIIIDGIYWIEKSKSGCRELMAIMKQLRDLVENYSHDAGGAGVRLKLLITSPKASLHVKHLFAKEKHLSLPTDMRGNELTLTQIQQQRHKRLKSNNKDSSDSNTILAWIEGVDSPP
jgi:hypothetical protein